jgi:hypothetical protein
MFGAVELSASGYARRGQLNCHGGGSELLRREKGKLGHISVGVDSFAGCGGYAQN